MTTEGEVMWQKNINETVFREIKQKLDAAEANYYAVGKEVLYAHPSLLDYIQKHPFEPTVEPVTQLINYDAIPILGIYNLTPKILHLLEPYHDFITLKVMTNHRSGEQYTDITAAGVNKAVAFEKWCELTGIQSKEVIGFGDSANDLEFLDLVGYSVAMGNATEEIKTIADRVIGHADENGLAEYLNDVVISGEL